MRWAWPTVSLVGSAALAVVLRYWAAHAIDNRLVVMTDRWAQMDAVQIWAVTTFVALAIMAAVCTTVSYWLARRIGPEWAWVVVALVAVVLWLLVVVLTSTQLGVAARSALSFGQGVASNMLTYVPRNDSYSDQLVGIMWLLDPGIGWQLIPISLTFFVLPAWAGASLRSVLRESSGW